MLMRAPQGCWNSFRICEYFISGLPFYCKMSVSQGMLALHKEKKSSASGFFLATSVSSHGQFQSSLPWCVTQSKSISVLTKFIQLVNIYYFFSYYISHRLSQTLSIIFYLGSEPQSSLQSRAVLLIPLLALLDFHQPKPLMLSVLYQPSPMEASDARGSF